ncbi:MAG TPA: HEAT repeat domain-containing protein [Candidatus Limnocylindrales bacterium]|nr:HEAT repeat domain-containing protein [Candidatus Limnocylindrales bacterium]
MAPRFKRVSVGVAIGMGCLVLLTWILIHTLPERDRLYKGRTLYDWLNTMNSPVVSTSNETRLVLQTEIIPDLTATMFNDTSDPKWKVALIDELNTLPGVNIFYTPSAGRRARAAASLGGLGPVAQAAVPDLIKALKGTDSAVRGAAAKALGDIKCQPETVIPLLINCLDDPQDDVPAAATEALGEFGPLSRPALPKLLPLLRKPDKDLQRALRVALKQIDPEEAAKAGVK